MNRGIKRALQVGTLLLAMIASIVLAAWWARRQTLRELSVQEGAQLQLRALALQRLIDRYRVFSSTLALDPVLRKALGEPREKVDTNTLNLKAGMHQRRHARVDPDAHRPPRIRAGGQQLATAIQATSGAITHFDRISSAP